ncbi:MAG: T9SS type A sorting domain-containing protein [Flavobacteriales bacterium]|nr:T9SS type A sorting domain-containing protein [Flavobacteriales bacterium]
MRYEQLRSCLLNKLLITVDDVDFGTIEALRQVLWARWRVMVHSTARNRTFGEMHHPLKYALLLVLLFCVGSAVGQANLVPNPSFEEYDFCTSPGVHGSADAWFVPYQGLTPDYFNSCSSVSSLSVPSNVGGHQYARTGEAYNGFLVFRVNSPEIKEFISVELNEILVANKQYVFTAYFSLADTMLYSVDNLGYLISDSLPSNIPLYEVTPSYVNEQTGLFNDKVNWVRMTDTITAAGGEKYLSIGCFFPDSLTDTTYVGQGTPGWTDAYYYIDDVSLIPLDSLLAVENQEAIEVDLYPNPASDHITLKSKKALKTAQLSDISGRRLWPMERRSGIYWETDLGSLPNGIYLIQAITPDGRRAVRKVVKAP